MGNIQKSIIQAIVPLFAIKSRLKWLIFIACCLLQQTTVGAQPKATATLKPERVETGDTFQLYIIVSGVQSQPKQVDFVSWSELIPPANMLSKSAWRRSGGQWVQQFTLIAFDSVNLELPALSVFQAAGKPLLTNSLSLAVYPTRGNGLADMAPIRDIYREPTAWTDAWPWALAALALIFLTYWLLRRSGKKKHPAMAVVPERTPVAPTAAEIALRKLSELQAANLWEKGQLKEHYASISLILREYLEGQYRVAALETTTAEVLSILPTSRFPAIDIPLLREILHLTDMVKYAQSTPIVSQHLAILEKARGLVAPISVQNTAQLSSTTAKPIAPKPNTGNYKPL